MNNAVADLISGIDEWKRAKYDLRNGFLPYKEISQLENLVDDAEQKIKIAIREICSNE